MRCVISDAIKKVFISFFYNLGYRRFVSRVQVLPTAVTQKTFKALPVRCSGETPPGARGIGKFCCWILLSRTNPMFGGSCVLLRLVHRPHISQTIQTELKLVMNF